MEKQTVILTGRGPRLTLKGNGSASVTVLSNGKLKTIKSQSTDVKFAA